MKQKSFTIDYSYSVISTENIFTKNKSILLNILKNKSQKKTRVAFVLDEGFSANHPEAIENIQAMFASEDDLILVEAPMVLPGGEQIKNELKYFMQTLELVDRGKLDRHAYLVCVGGGAMLDMVGFASAVAHRGIRHIRIPTTVLSQNDSGVGVKNGINFFGKKNFLGSFDPPVAVINDKTFLTTLSKRDWRAGIPEAIKVSLLKDPAFFHWIADHVTDLNERNIDVMSELVERCAELHTAHITGNGDPFEKGSSRPLDFGHWAAHKLEQLTDFELRHGEAVAIGLALDNIYAWQQGMLSESECQKILNTLHDLGFTLFHPMLIEADDINPNLLKGMEEFREHLGGELTIILLEAIGQPKEVHEMDQKKLTDSVKILLERYTS